MLKAGYLEGWEYRDTLSGVPQGGVVSPILSCTYLDNLDKFVEQELIPQYRETLGLELSPDKPLITRARSQPARFLGHDVTVQHCDTKLTSGRRSANGLLRCGYRRTWSRPSAPATGARTKEVIDAFFDLADVVITVRSLIQQARTLYRWDTRPARRP